MLTREELEKIKDEAKPEDVARLVSEIERLQVLIRDYGTSVSRKMDEIEVDILRLEAENTRLVGAKNVVCVERDFCVSLILQMAVAKGLKAGRGHGNVAVVELPEGQVSWEFDEEEAHLFSELPPYEGPIEELSIQQKYDRVMRARFQ